MNSIAFIAFTRRGCELAKRLAHQLEREGVPVEEPAGAIGSPAVSPAAGAADGVREGHFEAVEVSGPARFAEELHIRAYESLGAWTALHFAQDDALVFVSATGIAVRAIAPHVRDKFHDPAVVSVDEAGRFVVPLLSGHVGGANELARSLAVLTGGQAVVSTATDVNGLFAVDEWAARNNLAIVERALAKQVSAALLEGTAVGFAADEDVSWPAPEGVVEGAQAQGVSLGFAVSIDDAANPFERTLHLVPRVVTVGVGCRKGCEAAVLERAVDEALRSARVSAHAVVRLASIDVKRNEPAIAQLAEKRGWELRFYTADELAAVPGDFTASDFVRKTVGVDNVCERAALAEGGRLLLGKQAHDGTTVAIARASEDDAACRATRLKAAATDKETR